MRALTRQATLFEQAGAGTANAVNATVRALLRAHHGEVWRVLRHLGLDASAAEDAAQRVFLAAAGKLAHIETGKERAYLVGIAVRIAANERRAVAARREQLDESSDDRAVGEPGPDELLDEKRLRGLLVDVLDSLPTDLRTILVLYELEEFELADIAQMLRIPRGTVASRLRRAREAFERAARRVRARFASEEERR